MADEHTVGGHDIRLQPDEKKLPTALRNTRAKMRGARALQLHLIGRSDAEIADTLQYKATISVRQAYRRAMILMCGKEFGPDGITHAREKQYSRCELLISQLMPQAVQRNADPKISAQIVRLMERQAKLLGLDRQKDDGSTVIDDRTLQSYVAGLIRELAEEHLPRNADYSVVSDESVEMTVGDLMERDSVAPSVPDDIPFN